MVNRISSSLGDDQHKLWQNPVKPMMVTAFKVNGDILWHYDRIPDWVRFASRGDEELFNTRMVSGQHWRSSCGPASWGAPAIDGRGTVYASGMNGILYGIRDKDGNGVIDDTTEVDKFDLGAAALHAGASFAPGFMAYGSCDGLFVFRT